MIALEHVSKTYRHSKGAVTGLDDISLRINGGEFVVVRGPSGCGKSTLLMVIGGMLRPTQGVVRVAGEELYALSSSQRAAVRAAAMGFVFQMFHLVPYLSVIDNVMLGSRVIGGDRKRGHELLERLNLTSRMQHKPGELSIGERQRAALARAMMNQPKLILADEPTGNLDDDNAREVFDILGEYHRAGGTLIVVTHGQTDNLGANRVVHMQGGRIVDEAPQCSTTVSEGITSCS